MTHHYQDSEATYRLTHAGGGQTLIRALSPLAALAACHRPAIRIEVLRLWGWDKLRGVW